ncbi:AraC family transcriptional regulator [Nocardia blacklockiae]|nr:AraC family transcriptional regulator [Nocardia blacklockiae]
MAGFRGRTGELVDIGVVPYPAATMFLDFGDALLTDGTHGTGVRGSGVAGLGPADIRGRGCEIDCLQVRLSPVLAHAVFGSAAELSGTLVALDELWGPEAARLREQVSAARTWAERFALAEAACLRRLRTGRAVDPEVGFVWDRMVADRGQVRVEDLAAEVGWSRKRLWSRFRSQIGVTPKHAAKLVRFDHAAHRLAGGHGAALVAAETGYVDQSHLHRDAMAFAGLTPTAVAGAPWLAVDDVAWAAPAR